jgi:hypothetical protein
MKYFFTNDDGEIELEIASKSSTKTVFKVKDKTALFVPSSDWVSEVQEVSSGTALSLSRSYETVRVSYSAQVLQAPLMYPGGVDFELPTKAEVQDLLDTMNNYREQDLADNEEESPFFRNTPFELQDLISEIDVCSKARD